MGTTHTIGNVHGQVLGKISWMQNSCIGHTRCRHSIDASVSGSSRIIRMKKLQECLMFLGCRSLLFKEGSCHHGVAPQMPNEKLGFQMFKQQCQLVKSLHKQESFIFHSPPSYMGPMKLVGGNDVKFSVAKPLK